MENKKYKCGFCTFERWDGRKDIGSSFIRAEQLCKHWPEAELFVQGKKYDVIIFQKAYWVELARAFNGIKIFDLCDPDFLHWGYRTKEMLTEVDAVTTSTEALAKAVRQFTDKPVICISDRVDLNKSAKMKVHKGRARMAIWFGYSDNFTMIDQTMIFLEKNKLDLTVISNKNYLPQINFVRPEVRHGMNDREFTEVQKLQDMKDFWTTVTNCKWTKKTVDKDILSGDIVLNPQSIRGKWKFKSNNKTLKAWSLGMPVAHSVEELQKFLDPEARREEVKIRTKEIEEKWDVKISIDEFKRLIDKIKDAK